MSISEMEMESLLDDERERVVTNLVKNLALADLARLAARHGYSVVPDEPTEEMRQDGIDMAMSHGDIMCDEDPMHRMRVETSIARDIWRAMIQTGRVKP